MTPNDPLSFEDFQALLADLLDVDISLLTPEAYFVTDLGLDSLHMVQALLGMEQKGFHISLEAIWQIQTIGDAYRYYLEHFGGVDEREQD